MSPDALSVTVRGLSFVLLFQAIGVAIFTALFAELQNSTIETLTARNLHLETLLEARHPPGPAPG